MPRRKLTPELFDEMLRSYEAWDPMERTLDQWAEQWPVSKQSFFSAMKVKGILPKTMRPRTPAHLDLSGGAEMFMAVALEKILVLQLRVRDLEARLRKAGLPTD